MSLDPITKVSLLTRRWFGIAATLLMMAVLALLWVFSFSDLTFQIGKMAFCTIFLGPFGWAPSPFTNLPESLPWMPFVSVIGLCAHPVYPNELTFAATILGGLLWWIMGWYTMASVI